MPRKFAVVVGGDVFECHAAQLRQFSRGLDHVGRLVALAAFGDGREIRRVGFDQEAVGGREARGFLNVGGFGKRHDAAEAQMKAQIQRLLRLRAGRRRSSA